MKILAKDMKRGIVTIQIQSREDCWHLCNVVERGDFLSASTYRSKKESTDRIRSKKEEKEKVFLKIQVEDKEFQKFTDRLRIRGKIVEGCEEIGAYHTFSIEPGMKITVEKEWKEHHLRRLKDALKSHPKIAVVAMDDEMATIAKIHEYGVEEVATIHSHRPGKMYAHSYDEREYFGQVLSKLKEMGLPLAIVGPGFEKERFAVFAGNELRKFVVDTVSHPGMAGVYEALRRGVVERIMKENRVARETRIVERIMEYIAKNMPVAYGREEVERAVTLGAVEEMVILNSMLNEEEELIKKAEEMGAKLEIVNDWHEAGEKLASLGGLAAFLRYPLT
ncbi:MAG: mRNA surveillance protein pelota [Thermoplasmata archaeon]|nr:MAG: mRNA surveillance protein pelota [Thermoplasmata archaeon]